MKPTAGGSLGQEGWVWQELNGTADPSAWYAEYTGQLRFGALSFCCGFVLVGWFFVGFFWFGLGFLGDFFGFGFFFTKSSYQGDLELKMKGRCVGFLRTFELGFLDK